MIVMATKRENLSPKGNEIDLAMLKFHPLFTTSLSTTAVNGKIGMGYGHPTQPRQPEPMTVEIRELLDGNTYRSRKVQYDFPGAIDVISRGIVEEIIEKAVEAERERIEREILLHPLIDVMPEGIRNQLKQAIQGDK